MAAYNAFAAEVTAGMPKYGGDLFEGGCGCAGKFLGGAELAENAADYDVTANAAVHRELHGRADSAMDKLFKLGAGELSRGKLHARMDKIRGLKLAGSDVQRKVAGAIVETYSGAFEKSFKNLGQVRDFLKELAVGVRAESAGVKNVISRVINNMNTASVKMEDWLGKLETAIGVAELGAGQAEIKTYLAAARETVKFITHQAAAFKNLFEGIIAPTGKSIDDLISSTAVFDDLDKDLGSKEYAEQIREILQFGASFADKTKLFEESLKKLGSTMEAARGMSLGQLAETVSDAVRGKKDLEEMKTLIKAFEFVRKNFSLAKEIRGRGQVPAFYEGGDGVVPAFYEGGEVVPNFFTGGAEEIAAYFGAATVPAFYTGGNTVPAFYQGGVREFTTENSKTKIERELDVKKKLRAVILHAFSKRLFEELEKAVQALHVISIKIGTEIPLSDNLDAFRASLIRLSHVSQTDTPRLYALCGYFNDSTSKSIKEDFVAQLKTIIGYIDTLVEMNDYRASAQYFKSLQENLRAVIGVVDKFSDEVKEKFGAHDVKEGGDDDKLENFKKSEFQPRYKSPKTFMGAVTKFDYYYKSAQIKRNLTVAGKDMDAFSKDYPELVAKSIATVLQEELKKYETLKQKLELLKKFEPANPEGWAGAIFAPLNLQTDDHAKYNAAAAAGSPAKIASDKAKNDNSKWLKELAAAEKMLDQAWETKKKFWRTVEALDAYMKAFTDGIVNNPQDIRDIKAMLDDIPVVSEVYSKKSGDHLTKIFDSFPANRVGANANMNLAANALKLESAADEIAARKGEHYYSNADKLTATKLPGNHMICQIPTRVKASKEAAADMFRNVYYLKNLISVFVHIGSKFGGSELRSKITLSPTHIYDNLVNYLQNSAYSIGFGTGEVKSVAELNESTNGAVRNDGVTDKQDATAAVALEADNAYTGNYIYGALAQGMNMKDWVDANGNISNAANKPLAAYLKIFGTWMRTEGFKDFEGFSFKMEDEYFQLIMKSICAKIFTVIGTYDVFDRPLEYNGLSAVRMILGGSDEAPKVDDAAVELYLRLPLLLEFYKKIFGYDKDEKYDTKDYPHKNASGGLKISMVPDVDGVFAGLIKVIFRDSRFVKTRAYSDDTVAAIVREVNSIYQKMAQKYPAGEVVHKTVMELVNEVNRRYGVLSKKERDDYELGLNRGNAYGEWTSQYGGPNAERNKLRSMEDDDSREYAILPGEEDEADAQAVSRAEIMLDSTLPGNVSAVKSRNHYKIMAGHKEILYRFRCLIESQFNKTEENFSFAGTIKATRNKLKAVSSDRERFGIICGLVRGKDVTTARDSLAWLLFHETVVLGLNTLSAIHSILARFKQVVLATDVERILSHLASITKNLNNKAGVVGELQKEYFKNICAVDHELFAHVISDRTSNCDIGAANITAVNGALSPMTGKAKSLLKFPQEDADAKKATRLMFDSEKIMRLLVESLFAFGDDLQGLASVKFEQNMVNISTKGLKTLVGDLFESVNYFIDVLRPHIPIDTLDKYLEKETPGSYWWLHEQLMEKIIIGRDQIIGAEESKSKEYISLDRLSERVNSTWSWLLQDDSKLTIGQSLAAFNNGAAAGAGANSIAPKYGDIFAELVYYGADKQLKDTNGAGSTAAVSCVDFLNDPYESLHFSGQQGAKVIDTRFVARFKELYTFDEQITPNKSALFGFNQLVAKYIKQFYDTSVQKIYQGLVLPFAGNAFNQAVLDFKFTYPDVVPAVIAKGSLGESAAASPLFNLMGKLPPSQLTQVQFVKDVLNALHAIDPLFVKRAEANAADRSADRGINPAGNRAALYAIGANPQQFGTSKIDDDVNISDADLAYVIMAQVLVDKYIYDNVLDVAADHDFTQAGPFQGIQKAALRAILKRYDFTGTKRNGVQSVIIADAANTAAKARMASPASMFEWFYKTNANGGSGNVVVFAPGARFWFFDDTVAVVANATDAAGVPLAALKEYVDACFKTTTNANRVASSVIGRLIKTIPGALRIDNSTKNEIYDQLSHAAVYLGNTLHNIYNTNKVIAAAVPGVAGHDALVAKSKKAVAATYKEVYDAILSPARQFVPAHSGTPRHSAKYDEMITIGTPDNIIAPAVGPTGTLIMARGDAHLGLLEADTLGKNTGVPRPSGFAYNATHNNGQFGARADPDSEHVLFTSLSDIFRNLLTSRTLSTQAYVYLQDNVADITFHMKEKLRANLPAFKALFSAMINRCEFLRHISREGAIKLERDSALIANSKHNPWPFVLQDPTADDKTNRLRQHGILDSIIRGCTALVSSCDKVLMEIGDEPKFMELYQNSIKDYRARNGMDPFAPLSSVGKIFSNIRKASAGSDEDYSVFLPTHALGSNSSKFMYGTRALLHKFDAPSMAQAPGFASTMDYATLSVAGVEKRKIEAFFGAFVRAARYINETRHFKNILNAGTKLEAAFDAASSFSSADLIITDGGVNSAAGFGAGLKKNVTNKWDMSIIATADQEVEVNYTASGAGAATTHLLYNKTGVDLLARPIYQAKNSLSEVIQLTENTAREEQIKKVVEHIAKSLDENKTELDILNIIDLNIVPINVHALMRDIPLANLYNYSYTCDRMIIELFYGLKNKNAQKLIEQLCNASATVNPATNGIAELTSAKDLLTALLLNPYREITAAEGDLVHQMFVGATAIDGLGRPKFISDQIYNSAIFGEMYGSAASYSEVGPAANTGRTLAFDLETVAITFVTQFLAVAGYHAEFAAKSDANITAYARALVKELIKNPRLTVTELDAAVARPGNLNGNANAANAAEVHAATFFCVFVRAIVYFLMVISNAVESRAPTQRVAKLIDTMNVWINFTTYALADRHTNNLNWNEAITSAKAAAFYGKALNAKGAPVTWVSANLPDNGFAVRTVLANYDPSGDITYINKMIELISGFDVAWAAPGGAALGAARGSFDGQTVTKSMFRFLPENDVAVSNRAILHYVDNDKYDDDYPARWSSNNARLRPDNANVVSASQVKSVAINPAVQPILAELSKLRLDSRLIRNLIFIVNLYRAVRVKLQRDLTYDREVIQSSAAITKDSITEFFGNQLLGTEEGDWVAQRRRRYNY